MEQILGTVDSVRYVANLLLCQEKLSFLNCSDLTYARFRYHA